MNTPVAAPEASAAIPTPQFALRQAGTNMSLVALDLIAAHTSVLPADFVAKLIDSQRNWTTALTLVEDAERPARFPAIGSRFEGGIYAGIIRGVSGAPDQHLVLVDGSATNVTWSEATAWAAGIGAELPTRREQALLYANLPEQFEERWYWSGQQHASGADYAWIQNFGNGNQSNGHKSNQYRARAVRRFPI